MNCLHCNKEFTKTYHWRIDYCSIKCVTNAKEPCPICGKKIARHPNEYISRFVKRRFCSLKCSGSWNGKYKRTPETLKKQSIIKKKFEATPEGKATRAKITQDYLEWRKKNPEAAKEAVQKQHQARLERGVYEETSQRRRALFKTAEGERLKRKFSKLFSGKPRPPHVTQKMKASLRKYWDSPEGLRLREEISAKMTDSLDDTPYGPGWPRQRSKIRQRDSYQCIICHTTKEDMGRCLDVHHIYNRRLFGYIPGHNQNYLWANHPANLITVCQSCHGKIEMGSLTVPTLYQERADQLWQRFTVS